MGEQRSFSIKLAYIGELERRNSPHPIERYRLCFFPMRNAFLTRSKILSSFGLSSVFFQISEWNVLLCQVPFNGGGLKSLYAKWHSTKGVSRL
jgi:hypothetical protein